MFRRVQPAFDDEGIGRATGISVDLGLVQDAFAPVHGVRSGFDEAGLIGGPEDHVEGDAVRTTHRGDLVHLGPGAEGFLLHQIPVHIQSEELQAFDAALSALFLNGIHGGLDLIGIQRGIRLDVAQPCPRMRLPHLRDEGRRFRRCIGDAMRGLYEHPAAQPSDFTRRVMDALKNEPVVLAPVPKPVDRRPALWLAAATMAAITWGLWQSSPRDEINAPLAALQQPAAELAAELAAKSANASPYLAAHQDFAQAVISAPEMHFSKASLEVRQ